MRSVINNFVKSECLKYHFVNLHISAAKGKRFRGQKRPRQDTTSNVKNGGTKPTPHGQHKRFDEDDDDEKMKETEEKVASTTADEDEPKAKQAKAE